jgi:hypothetical protein
MLGGTGMLNYSSELSIPAIHMLKMQHFFYSGIILPAHDQMILLSGSTGLVAENQLTLPARTP